MRKKAYVLVLVMNEFAFSLFVNFVEELSEVVDLVDEYLLFIFVHVDSFLNLSK